MVYIANNMIIVIDSTISYPRFCLRVATNIRIVVLLCFFCSVGDNFTVGCFGLISG